MKTTTFRRREVPGGGLPALLLVLAACSSSPPPPAESEPSPEPGTPSQASEPASNEVVEQGKLLIQDEKYGQAKKVLADARKRNPMDPQAAYYLGVALEGLKDTAGAEKQYRDAIKLDPKLVEPSLNLSQLLLDAGDAKGALSVIDAALKTSPKHPDLLLNRAVALEKSGNKADVLAAYAAASAARPGDPMLHAVYGGLLSEAGKSKEAVVELKAALTAEDPALLMSIASVLTKENAFDECLQACERAMLKKKAPAVLVRRGICKDGKKDTPGAIVDFEAALAMDPNFVPAHFYYGLSLAATDKAKALEHVDKAIAGAPPDNPLLPEAKKRAAELRAAVEAEKKGGKTAAKPKK